MVFLYTFNCAGTKFYLSRKNLNTDAPNKLTELVDRWPRRRYFVLDTDPKVFAHLVRHLRGYSLGDLTHLDVRREDLECDAERYGLLGLIDEISLSTAAYQPLLESWAKHTSFMLTPEPSETGDDLILEAIQTSGDEPDGDGEQQEPNADTAQVDGATWAQAVEATFEGDNAWENKVEALVADTLDCACRELAEEATLAEMSSHESDTTDEELELPCGHVTTTASTLFVTGEPVTGALLTPHGGGVSGAVTIDTTGEAEPTTGSDESTDDVVHGPEPKPEGWADDKKDDDGQGAPEDVPTVVVTPPSPRQATSPTEVLQRTGYDYYPLAEDYITSRCTYSRPFYSAETSPDDEENEWALFDHFMP